MSHLDFASTLYDTSICSSLQHIIYHKAHARWSKSECAKFIRPALDGWFNSDTSIRRLPPNLSNQFRPYGHSRNQ